MQHIIELLKVYQEYSKIGNQEDFGEFGDWLKQKYSEEDTHQTNNVEVNKAGTDVMVSYLLGGLVSYVEVWVKLTFEDLPLISLGDFGILMTVKFSNNPTKKEIANQAIMERSTCIESIKRLIKKGILTEEADVTDKRLRRVSLTEEGHQVVEILNARMVNLGKLLTGNLSETEKMQLIPSLNKLNMFHESLYKKKDELDIKKQYNLDQK